MAISLLAGRAKNRSTLRSDGRISRPGRPGSSATVKPQGAQVSVLTAHQRALGRLRAYVQTDRRLQHEPDAQGFLLRPHMASVLLAHKTPTGKGTVVLFHGYTAGPWQYPEMARRFFKAGYDVFVPRLPGHGMMTRGGTPTGAEIPGLTQEAAYGRFVDTVYSDVAALGGPVYGVGLSGGADLAMEMAVRHPAVKRVALMSPYLGPDGTKGKVFQTLLKWSHEHPWVRTILDHVPTEFNVKWQSWMGSSSAPFAKWPMSSWITSWLFNVAKPADPLPHTEGSLGAALAMLEVGRDIRKVPCPAQFLNTQGDFLSGTGQVKPLFERSGGPSRDGWFIFNKNLDVPHAMLSPKEDKVPGAAQRVQDTVFNFVNQGKLTD